ncbi:MULTISPECIES: ATP-binding protein [unclassified Nocardioides]|uniref:ATP-binding protein n=1 Tax=unclassified Nocardioides TaxID=2615069 RepID=UPI001885BFEB|nr:MULTISPECIES: ATP-binding protein [unclassified Nocardioides]
MTEDNVSGTEDQGSRVEAKAEKRFFIEMLIKDIELLPAIVDLADNSIDAARRLHPDGNLAGQWVNVNVSPTEFRIQDNSGGIDIDVARQYAFRFGRAREFQGVPKSVGQFGVGMKRAIFKIGDEFEVTSAYKKIKTDTLARGDSRFTMKVDVREWEKKDDWSFTLGPHEEATTLGADVEAGSTIVVRKLHLSVADDFKDGSIIDDLKRELRLRHQESLDRGLTLTVNGRAQTGTRPTLQQSELISPIRRTFDVAVPEKDGKVRVEIFAGTIQGETKRDGDEVDLGDAESFQDPSDAGWYLFCNDRLLMVADTSSVTGWGNPAAAFHPQYRLFRGYVYLSADDASLLPWNTTKTAVDRDSTVFRSVASAMKSTLVEVQAAINKQVKARRNYLADVREVEARGVEAPPAKPQLLAAFDETDNVPLRDLPDSPKMVTPPEPLKKRAAPPPPPDFKRIQYEVDLEDFERVSVVLGTSSGSEVGRQTFAYFLDAEVH